MVMRNSTNADPGRLVYRRLIGDIADGIPAGGRSGGYSGQAYEYLR
jgi:hypothetical protein